MFFFLEQKYDLRSKEAKAAKKVITQNVRTTTIVKPAYFHMLIILQASTNVTRSGLGGLGLGNKDNGTVASV